MCSTGSSPEITEKVAELEVTERFESKHLPVEIQIGRRSKKCVPKHNCPSHTVKLIWDDNKSGLYGIQLTPDIIELLIMLFADDIS